MEKNNSLKAMKAIIEKLRQQIKKLATLGPRLRKKEKELKESKKTFEKRVNIRTEAERIIHRQLHGEIKHYEQVEQSLEQELEYVNNVLDTIRNPFIILDENLKVISANRAFYQMFKVSPETTKGHHIYDLGNRQWNIPKLRELIEDIIPHVTSFDDFEVVHDFPDIGKKTMLLNARKIMNKTNQGQFILLNIEDITQRKKDEEVLNALAHYDELTGCVNYRSVMEIVAGEIERSKRYKKEFSVIMTDIDHFKRINDTYGHLVGNDVLIAFAHVVKKGIRNVDIVGRYGGDEFIMILPETDACQAAVVLARIRIYLTQGTITALQGEETREITVQFSAGIATFPSQGHDTKTLIEAADSALCRAKKEKDV